jgi:hypothetical protein
MPSTRAILAALLALIAAIGVTVVVTDNGPDHGPTKPRGTVTVTLGGPGHKKVALPPAAQAIVKTAARDDAQGNVNGTESDLHESQLPPASVEQKAQALTPPGQPAIPPHVPLASASEPGCTTALVRNYSSRRGAPVLFGFIHWTGSRPTPGSTAGGLAIVHWFDTPAAQASSNYITDQQGRCWLTVPESQKAWTQANANSWGVSVEIINQGVMPLFQTPAARAIVVRLMRAWHAHWKIPYRHGIVAQGPGGTCVPVRSGFLSHRDGGACAGGHPDVGSFDLDGLIREAANVPTVRPVTSTDRATCRRLQWWRTHGRPHGKPMANAVRRKAALTSRHRTCTSKGVS